MKKLFSLFICLWGIGISYTGVADQKATDKKLEEKLSAFDKLPDNAMTDPEFQEMLKRRLLGSWGTINTLIPEVKQSYDTLMKATTEDKKMTESFEMSISALLQAYSFFFYSLQDQTFTEKYKKLVRLTVSYNESKSKEAMAQTYTETEKLNKEWQSSFPTKESILEKWKLFK